MGERLKKFADGLKKRRAFLGVLGLLVSGGAVWFFFWGNRTSASDYITAKIERGNVDVNVAATGTVQAVTTVLVGSQVSGTVQWLGADFNTQVKRGQVIAKLDPTLIQAQVDNARASVVNQEAAVQAATTEIANQQANLSAAKANLEVTRVQREDAKAVVKRYQEIKEVIAGRDIELAQANASTAAARYEQAAAQVLQAQGAINSARARLEQAKAQLQQAKAQVQQSATNLNHTIITSPIDGIVVSRSVDVGQTVAASLQAPTLFTIANDLTKMQVLASIDEADVGQIKQGTKANFNVDAFPGETFTGEITQVRLNAQTLQNVVTYSAVIEFSNPELKLRPGMTTNITIPVARRENVLTVPNAALRFRPNFSEEELSQRMEEYRNQRAAERGQGNSNQGEQGGQGGQGARGDQQSNSNQGEQPQGGRRGGDQQAQQQQSGQQQQGGQQAQQRQPGQGGGQGQAGGGGGQRGRQGGGQTVWVLVGEKKIEPRFIRTGLTNGRVTEIIAGDLHEGDTIVVGQNETNGGGNRTQQPTTPFGQRPPGGGGPRGR